jgi:hypothetical protein
LNTKTSLLKILPASLLILLLLGSQYVLAQKNPATITGKIVDENDNPMSGVSITILGRQSGIQSSDSGTFKLNVPAAKAFALQFSYTGYTTQQRSFLLNENEQESIVVRLEKGSGTLDAVVITDQRQRRETGLVVINPKHAINIPSPTGGIESLIKIFVGSNNELTSQYTVRGGNYDENLIYVNDFEVFRPYLVRSGQQEGLSFINPELARNVQFYNGGFQARYGDKMSSVLDIQYKRPRTFGGSAYIGLLEQGIHFEGSGRSEKFTYLIGARNRSNRNLFSSQETKGNYVPSSADLQALITYRISNKHSIELLGNISRTKFTLQPSFSQLTSTVFSPFFSANLGLDIYFDGREEDRYFTNMVGLSLMQQPTSALRLKWMLSRFQNTESESVDITGAYLFGEREFDKSKPDFGLINNPLGAGLYQNFARNTLDISIWNAGHKGSLDKGDHFLQWGINAERQSVRDKLNEWDYQDSAGYNLPYTPGALEMSRVVKSSADIEINRLSGYIQDNIRFHDTTGFTLQAGLRFNYNDLNRQLLLSPRFGFSYKPLSWMHDVIFRGALGAYHQPPFYRELRRYDGSVNRDVRAQKSWQIIAGMDYNFRYGNRPFRVSSEAYFKLMHDVVPYDIDNVRLRYFGENIAKAYAAGMEVRLFGELVKDAESWISLGFLKTMEDIDNDTYYNYILNENGIPIDSSLVEGGYLRRPTDRRFTVGMFLQDYLSTNKNFRVYLNLLYGSNLPYNIPQSVKYRNALHIEPYIRIDMGFSALLLDSERSNRRSHHPFRNFENVWATLEVFNLIDRDNTISYLLIKDFSNTVFAMPNRLTPRLLNFKLVARF